MYSKDTQQLNQPTPTQAVLTVSDADQLILSNMQADHTQLYRHCGEAGLVLYNFQGERCAHEGRMFTHMVSPAGQPSTNNQKLTMHNKRMRVPLAQPTQCRLQAKYSTVQRRAIRLIAN